MSAGEKAKFDTPQLFHFALVVLLDRAGGTFSATEEEYESVVARYGGKEMMVLRAEVLKGRGAAHPDEIRVRLIGRTAIVGDRAN